MVEDRDSFVRSIDSLRDYFHEDIDGHFQDQELFCECNLVTRSYLAEFTKSQAGQDFDKFNDLLLQLKVGSGCGKCLKACPPKTLFEELSKNKE